MNVETANRIKVFAQRLADEVKGSVSVKQFHIINFDYDWSILVEVTASKGTGFYIISQYNGIIGWDKVF